MLSSPPLSPQNWVIETVLVKRFSQVTILLLFFQGTHPSLSGSAKALATVTSIIDGTGSIGAAIGPFLAGAIPNLKDIFYMLMASDVLALLVGNINSVFVTDHQHY